MISSPDYSIIVPAYNEEAFLPSTLAGLRAAMAGVTEYVGEVIVVDNNSTDRTAEIARDWGAAVVFEPINQIARARNAGALVALGRHLVFVDADTRITATLLAASLQALDRRGAYAGGAEMQFDQELPRLAQFFTRAWNRWCETFRIAAGAYLFCRADLFRLVGGFPESVYASEELHLCHRLVKPGLARGLHFVTIRNYPVISSARKFQWYSLSHLLLTVLPILLCPFLLRSKRFCRFWYDRPQKP
jgi:glycosyltransferase involved in cell wall biosynthesis